MDPLPVLLLDVGFAATGVAVATLHDDGVHVALSVIVPTDGLSTAARNEKRSCIYFGNVCERLYFDLIVAMSQRPGFAAVFAEVPVMGSRSAAGMRSMALALACYHCARRSVEMPQGSIGIDSVEFTRNDVLAAALGSKKISEQTKMQTRALVSKLFIVDDSALPPTKMVKHKRTGAMLPCEKTEDLRDNAYDAAAVLFAAKDHDLLRRTVGWGDAKIECGAS